MRVLLQQNSICSKQSIFDRIRNEATIKTQINNRNLSKIFYLKTFDSQTTLLYNPENSDISKGKRISQRKQQLRSNSKASYKLQCSFQPFINYMYYKIKNLDQSYKKISQAKKFLGQIKKKKESIQMINQYQIILKKLEQTMMTEYLINHITTGQKLFNPIIGRPPIYEKNNSNLPIEDQLFQMRTVQEDHLNYLIQQQRQSLINLIAKSYEKTSQISQKKEVKCA